jgi:hypothetical protein
VLTSFARPERFVHEHSGFASSVRCGESACVIARVGASHQPRAIRAGTLGVRLECSVRRIGTRYRSGRRLASAESDSCRNTRGSPRVFGAAGWRETTIAFETTRRTSLGNMAFQAAESVPQNPAATHGLSQPQRYVCAGPWPSAQRLRQDELSCSCQQRIALRRHGP